MILTDPIFTDEAKAREHLEATRWPQGPECPHCGVVDQATLLHGKAHRPGVYECRACRDQFTATVGTVFERSKVPLNKWMLASYLMASSKKGVSAHQLHRTLGVTYKTAWFMAHRLREAMKPTDFMPFGVGGGAVEVDETFIGTDKDRAVTKPVKKHGRRTANMNKIVTLVDRNSGEARSKVVKDLSRATLWPFIAVNVEREARLMTDEFGAYVQIGEEFAQHGRVNHSAGEYVSRADRSIHTNTVEGFYAIFKRGMKGIYQHCGQQHLHRYITEFDFRYSARIALGVDDEDRTAKLLRGIGGRRLTYRRIGDAHYA
ncbi:MAG: IS1595 family transposase [Caulobacteraceae bacterium]|nr:IS1595 family transposase [Caulobacteraceae bacterium]